MTGEQALIPLAGPANRQGRIAADVIMGKEPSKFRGTQGTAVVGVFGMTCASTGANERTLKRAGIPYKKVRVAGAGERGAWWVAAALPLLSLLLSRPTHPPSHNVHARSTCTQTTTRATTRARAKWT